MFFVFVLSNKAVLLLIVFCVFYFLSYIAQLDVTPLLPLVHQGPSNSLLFCFCEVELQRMSEGTIFCSFFPLVLFLTSMCSHSCKCGGWKSPKPCCSAVYYAHLMFIFFCFGRRAYSWSLVSLPPQYLGNLVNDMMMPAWRRVSRTWTLQPTGQQRLSKEGRRAKQRSSRYLFIFSTDAELGAERQKGESMVRCVCAQVHVHYAY